MNYLPGSYQASYLPVPVGPPADLDAIADWYIPSSNDQWAALGLDSPDHGWLCNEASGNLVDYNAGLTLTATTTPTYAQTTAYFTRPGVGLDDNTADRFIAGSGTGPGQTEDQLWLFLVSLRVEATAARIIGGAVRCASSTDNARVALSPSAGTNRLQLNLDAVTTTGSQDHAVGRHMFALRYNPTITQCAAYSELEKVTAATPSFALVDGDKGIGGNTSADIVCHAAYLWRASKARKTDAEFKTLLQTLRITIPWS